MLDISHKGVDHEEPVKDGEYPFPMRLVASVYFKIKIHNL